MKVLVFDQQKDLKVARSSVKPVIEEILSGEGIATDEVSVYFVKTEEIARLHQQFFQDPSPTDCISFPMDDTDCTGHHILGEVFICPKTAIDFIVKTEEVTATNCYREITLYLIHGILHLLGYDDLENESEKLMRQAENTYMQRLIAKKTLLHS